ncbi:Homeobox-leucine zipper protein ROC8 [Zea mays]|uniref:Homeobox-leucine zipper protein ROC8 n=1 Tax=Zea mays TaxID=4577 RepID=A0A3L6E896_MAIZE|nr:Homeobox-leucine zipper protein ROC8 [Zea mays]
MACVLAHDCRMFKECPHPDENQRAALSRELGLEPRQIKFWFQNRRTQMKAQHERADNCFLRAENDKIRCENITMREALKNVICPSCGGPPVDEDFFDEQKLRMENARLKEELDRVSSITSKYLGRPFTQMPPVPTMSMSSLDLSVGGMGSLGGPSLDLDLLSGCSSGLPYQNKWMEFFPGIVSKAQTVDVLVNGLGGRSESLIMVTWVEHMEIEQMLPINVLYRNLVLSGAAFGAHRWLAALQRACERFASVATLGVPHHDVAGVTPEGKRSMTKLSQRMVSSFCASLSSSPLQRWTLLSGTTDVSVRVSTHRSTDSGQPNGVVLSAATSIWLPVPGDHVFAFVRDENARSQWDVLSHGNQVQEVSRIPNGSNPGNCISLLRGLNANQNSMLILQESCTDASGALVVYSPIDIPAANVVMSGEDPSGIPLLPSGFAILPGPGAGAGASSSAVVPPPGCVVTVAFQILVSNLPSSRLNAESVATVNSLIGTTVQQIKAALNCAGH